MANGKFISYLRVSTLRQGRSGLGIEAQREAIRYYLNGGQWTLLDEYIEIESGKKNDRPKLLEALKACRLTGATLIIAKLDRLSRNVKFITELMESGVDFAACDLPSANKFVIHIMAALAQQEREMISTRTKVALEAAKARGKQLGNPVNLNNEAAQKGRVLGMQKRVENADEFSLKLNEHIKKYLEQGLSLNAIARQLNSEGVLTARGKTGAWTPTAVKNVINRYKTMAHA